MERDKALYAVSLLIGAIGTESMWPPETIDTYVAMLEDLNDGDLLIATCEEIGQTWNADGNQFGKPTPGFIRKAYGTNVMRRETHWDADHPRGELASGDKPINWRRGIEIARENCNAERAKLGKEPDEGWMMYWLLGAWGKVTPKTPWRPRGRGSGLSDTRPASSPAVNASSS